LSEAQALLAKEAAGRTAAEHRAGELAELRGAVEQELAASRQQKENLQGELRAAQAAVAGLVSRVGELESGLRAEAAQRETWERRAAELEQARVVLQGEIGKWAEREGQLKSECARLQEQAQAQVSQLASRVGELDSQLKDQISQTQAWEQRNAEKDRVRALLEGEIRQHVEREGALKANCAAFELQLTRIGESLAQTRARVDAEEASRAAAEARVEELSQLQIAAGRQLAERARLEKQLRLRLEEGAKRLSDCEAKLLEAETLVVLARKSIHGLQWRYPELPDNLINPPDGSPAR
jgi:chromosome segregation ATPase